MAGALPWVLRRQRTHREVPSRGFLLAQWGRVAPRMWPSRRAALLTMAGHWAHGITAVPWWPCQQRAMLPLLGVEFLGVEKALLPPLVPSARLSWHGSWTLGTPVLYPRPHHQRLQLELPGCTHVCACTHTLTRRHGHVCSLTNVLCVATHTHICRHILTQMHSHIHRCGHIYSGTYTRAYDTQGFVHI